MFGSFSHGGVGLLGSNDTSVGVVKSLLFLSSFESINPKFDELLILTIFTLISLPVGSNFVSTSGWCVAYWGIHTCARTNGRLGGDVAAQIVLV